MMVVDTSALLAIVFAEPEYRTLRAAIRQCDGSAQISVASVLEASIVLLHRHGKLAEAKLDSFIRYLGLNVAGIDAAQLSEARIAYQRYGKGQHAAGLNFGDCFSYALAKTTGLPLLFRGEDFSRTDIAAVMP
jgi:ribonuclease VapC